MDLKQARPDLDLDDPRGELFERDDDPGTWTVHGWHHALTADPFEDACALDIEPDAGGREWSAIATVRRSRGDTHFYAEASGHATKETAHKAISGMILAWAAQVPVPS